MSTIDEMKKNRDIEGLIKLLMTGDMDQRMYSSIALSEMGEEAIEPLIQVMRVGSEDARHDAAWALSKIGEPALEPLNKAMEEGDEKLRYYASIARGQMWLQGHDFKPEYD